MIILAAVNINIQNILIATSWVGPYVATIVVEMLQNNPNISPELIRYILQSTTNQIGGYEDTNDTPQNFSDIGLSWNNQVGFGEVSRIKAVQGSKELLDQL